MSRAPILLAMLLVGGCVVPKRAGFDDVERRLSARTPYRVHWDQGTEADRRVADETRRLLSAALTIESATQIALYNNPELQAVYERLGVAQADVVQAGLLRNPRISLHWGFALTSGVDELAGSITGAFLDLFLMPLKKHVAHAELESAELEVADAVLGKIESVAEAFYTVQAATQSVELRRTILDGQRAALALLVRQHEAGNVNDLDLANERAAYAQAKLDLGRAEFQLLGDRERLTRLLGVWGFDVEYKVAPKLPEPPAEEPELAHLESVAIAHRLDLEAARNDVQAASWALRMTKGTRVLNGLDLGVQAHRDPDGPVTVGPTIDLELPIFDQKQAEVARRRATLHAAEHRADALAIAVRSEVRQARNRLLEARLGIDTYKNALVPERERIVALSQEQYDAMLIGVYPLLVAKQNEIATYRDYIDSVRDYFIARAALERAIGTTLASLGKETAHVPHTP